MVILIRGAALGGFARLVDELGGDPGEFVRRFAIAPDALTSDEGLVPITDHDRMLDAAARDADCPDLGLRPASRTTPQALLRRPRADVRKISAVSSPGVRVRSPTTRAKDHRAELIAMECQLTSPDRLPCQRVSARLRPARCAVDDGRPLRPAAERFQVSHTGAARWTGRPRLPRMRRRRPCRGAHGPRRKRGRPCPATRALLAAGRLDRPGQAFGRLGEDLGVAKGR